MGTNFYWAIEKAVLPTGVRLSQVNDHSDPLVHIGKRSAAGIYCWDCGLTLCLDGERAIHSGDARWSDACPKCGAKQPSPTYSENPILAGPVGVELGFSSPRTARPTGVRGAASFSWAQDPVLVEGYCRRHPRQKAIKDEYDRKLTCAEFLTMLEANCPIRFTHSLGIHFS
jgi:hypothetical protein